MFCSLAVLDLRVGQFLLNEHTLFCSLAVLDLRVGQFLLNEHTLFCSLAVLDPRVGHTMDVLSPFVPVLCHSD